MTAFFFYRKHIQLGMHAESSPSEKKNVVMKDLHADVESHSAPHSSGCPTAQGLVSIRQRVVPRCNDNHVMLRNTKAFVVDANVQNAPMES